MKQKYIKVQGVLDSIVSISCQIGSQDFLQG